MVRPASRETYGKADLGRRVAVVGRHSDPVEKARKARKALLPRGFKTGNMRVRPVDRLVQLEASKLAGRKSLRGVVNRIGQILVKEASLQDAQRLEVVFHQHVVIIAARCFPCGVSDDA